METLKILLQPYINTPIWVDYDCIESGYTKILIVENNQIVEIGEFIYNIWRNNLYEQPKVQQLLVKLAQAAEQYRTTREGFPATLCYYGGELCVNFIPETEITNK